MSAARASVRESGFTMLEMLLVIALLALAAAIVAPRLHGPPDRLLLQAAATDLASRLHALRLAAIRTNTDQTLTLDPSGRTYWTSLDRRPRALPAGISVAVSGDGFEAPAAGLSAVRFHPDGSARDAHIVLRGGDGAADIAIEWLSGASRIAWRP